MAKNQSNDEEFDMKQQINEIDERIQNIVECSLVNSTELLSGRKVIFKIIFLKKSIFMEFIKIIWNYIMI